MRSLAEFRDPNVVKVVTDDAGLALLFSRAPIPHSRDAPHSFAAARRHLQRAADGTVRPCVGTPLGRAPHTKTKTPDLRCIT